MRSRRWFIDCGLQGIASTPSDMQFSITSTLHFQLDMRTIIIVRGWLGPRERTDCNPLSSAKHYSPKTPGPCDTFHQYGVKFPPNHRGPSHHLDKSHKAFTVFLHVLSISIAMAGCLKKLKTKKFKAPADNCESTPVQFTSAIAQFAFVHSRAKLLPFRSAQIPARGPRSELDQFAV